MPDTVFLFCFLFSPGREKGIIWLLTMDWLTVQKCVHRNIMILFWFSSTKMKGTLHLTNGPRSASGHSGLGLHGPWVISFGDFLDRKKIWGLNGSVLPYGALFALPGAIATDTRDVNFPGGRLCVIWCLPLKWLGFAEAEQPQPFLSMLISIVWIRI